MLDVNALMERQKHGEQVIASLPHDELVILQNFAVLAARALRATGQHANQSTANTVLNAYRAGIALGLGLDIAGGSLRARK